MGWTNGKIMVQFPSRRKHLSPFQHHTQPSLLGTLSSGIKRAGQEAGHSFINLRMHGAVPPFPYTLRV
jgi:hypothetical protein